MTKDFLFQARKIDLEIDALIEARAKIHAQCTKTTAILSSMPKGSSNPHKYDKLAEINDAIESKLEDAINIKYDVFNAISLLENKEEKSVMLDYYINGLTIWEIAQRTNYSTAQVKRIKKEATRKLINRKMIPNELE